MSRSMRVAILCSALFVGSVSSVAAQGPEPIDQPPEFAAVRAEFENMTAAEVEAAGYVPEPVCISELTMGGMGIHALHPTLLEAQFTSAEPDTENPPIVLLSADRSRVVGLEWEAADIGQGDMELFGQEFPLLPGHPGVPEPHYMFHAYFKPNGQVLFSVFDPELSCAVPSTALEAPDQAVTLGWTLIAAAISVVAVAISRRTSSPLRR